MIKAEYLGISDDPLEYGKVYKISTRCKDNKLVVSVRNVNRCYTCLEQFLKEWKVRVVYSGKSGTQTARERIYKGKNKNL